MILAVYLTVYFLLYTWFGLRGPLEAVGAHTRATVGIYERRVAKVAIIAFCEVARSGVRSTGSRLCFVNWHSQSEIPGNCERGRAVAFYVKQISPRAGRKTGNHVQFYRRKTL